MADLRHHAAAAAVVAVTAQADDDAPPPSEEGTLFAAVLVKPITKEGVRAILHKLGFIEGIAV